MVASGRPGRSARGAPVASLVARPGCRCTTTGSTATCTSQWQCRGPAARRSPDWPGWWPVGGGAVTGGRLQVGVSRWRIARSGRPASCTGCGYMSRSPGRMPTPGSDAGRSGRGPVSVDHRRPFVFSQDNCTDMMDFRAENPEVPRHIGRAGARDTGQARASRSGARPANAATGDGRPGVRCAMPGQRQYG